MKECGLCICTANACDRLELCEYGYNMAADRSYSGRYFCLGEGTSMFKAIAKQCCKHIIMLCLGEGTSMFKPIVKHCCEHIITLMQPSCHKFTL